MDFPRGMDFPRSMDFPVRAGSGKEPRSGSYVLRRRKKPRSGSYVLWRRKEPRSRSYVLRGEKANQRERDFRGSPVGCFTRSRQV
jgi:hypothetical protein